MGKALVFRGVTVKNPLQTIHLTKTLVTAGDYSQEYAAKCALSSTHQDAVKNLVSSLMEAGVWDIVKCLYPMLGGMGNYNTDLRNPAARQDWGLAEGTVWDDVRNAPFMSMPGNTGSTPIEMSGFDVGVRGCSFFFSLKTARDLVGSIILAPIDQSGRICNNDYIIGSLYTSNGGYVWPTWGTAKQDKGGAGLVKNANSYNGYLVTVDKDTNTLYANSNRGEVSFKDSGPRSNTNNTDQIISIGGKYTISAPAPATGTLNGCPTCFMAFDRKLSDSEVAAVFKAVGDFDAACGRTTDFQL